MTNVKPNELNYDQYTVDKYDRDIVNSIPFHKEIHLKIAEFIKNNFKKEGTYSIIDLGVGTALTTKIVQDLLPKANIEVVDFSERMLQGAKERLGDKVTFILGDYAEINFGKEYDMVISVIGLHHQTHEGKIKLFNKIYSMLNPMGVFIFGDLITYQDKRKAALNDAKHFHHLVEKSSDEKSLEEWAHHHRFLNHLEPIEDQIALLKDAGFSVQEAFLKINTALLFCKKPKVH